MNLSDIKTYSETTFEGIKHLTDDGIEFWYARELSSVLEYAKWENFSKAIKRAKDACLNSAMPVKDHFADVRKMVDIGSGAEREIEDIMLTRYACYLIVQNADSKKEVVALGQTYFAIQTRKQEIEEFTSLGEDERRLELRQSIKGFNKSLADAAHNAGVTNYGRFQNFGYKGLYNGETAARIKEIKRYLKK